MIKEMIVNSTTLETKVAILEDDQLAELYIERNRSRGILGNIYKGKVTKVLPGMQSAFVQIGLEKDAFLYVSDFVEDTEEYEKVFTKAEEQVESAMKEMDTPARVPKRERRNDKPRWRERRERAAGSRSSSEREPAKVTPAVDQVQQWFLGAETERAAGNRAPAMAAVVPLPAAAAPAAKESAAAAPPLESASLTEGGELIPFAVQAGSSKGTHARRRGPGARRKRFTAARHTRRREHQSIGDMLQEGQEILVQVAKEPIAKKGARVTSHIALPGRYLVYMPTVDHIGVSRKIGSEAERIRLRDVILKQRDGFPGGVIVRTAAANHSEEDLTLDLKFLVRMWEEIRSRAETISAPALVHSELNLVQRLLRDQFSFEFANIRVDDEVSYQEVVEFVDKIYPNLVHRVKLFTKDTNIYDEYGISPEIEKLLQPKIWLKSGGYIVINQTEALVSIDINTGKYVGRGNSLEETITRTNVEAVVEIVKQIRLRDLGGIIVIDFIDMDERKNRKRVMEALSQEIAKDKAPSKTLEFNEFGLVAITRKRVKQSLERTLCQACPYCHGSGMVKSIATTCHNIFHEIEKMSSDFDEKGELMIRVHPEVARALRETESAVVEEIRNMLDREVLVKSDPAVHIEDFNIVN
jgi:ribonuclease G